MRTCAKQTYTQNERKCASNLRWAASNVPHKQTTTLRYCSFYWRYCNKSRFYGWQNRRYINMVHSTQSAITQSSLNTLLKSSPRWIMHWKVNFSNRSHDSFLSPHIIARTVYLTCTCSGDPQTQYMFAPHSPSQQVTSVGRHKREDVSNQCSFEGIFAGVRNMHGIFCSTALQAKDWCPWRSPIRPFRWLTRMKHVPLEWKTYHHVWSAELDFRVQTFTLAPFN